MKKAQVSFEFLIAALVAMIMLLIGVTAYAQQNILSSNITSINSDSIECNRIADSISEIYASQGIAEKNIFLNKIAIIQKIALKPGQITVGAYSCYYFGNSAKDTNPANPPNPDTADTDGFSLGMGTYKLTKTGGFVVFTGQ